ncbi:MAG TPA: DNA polymerase III subunit gamma/tau [Bryobacteraceae bacterium]|nr:DNA polymerase III subunit gamma/tau [Bryobacteraceae bacterium]
MYQVIARKYRPQTFAEVLCQEHVKTTLENAIAQKRIAHGYIFSGQRGTGKTTIARILARCLNCTQGPTPAPCGECPSCREISAGGTVDVIEIDAASNRGINEMRELRENVRYQPARDRYKVFIIDEAHQITTEAFNALLKTIEEPPPWVVFVLCTTEAHKIPATIASRCQHFSFRSVDFEELTRRMAAICAQEGIEADADALAVIAQAGEGSVRDSLSALDQAIACCGARLNAADVRALLGAFSLESLEQVSHALLEGNAARMLEVVDELERNGHNLQHFSRELSRYFRNLLVMRIAATGAGRLVAASEAQRQRLAETAARFSEEDLTRYLQLSLDLFRDLQFSLQPRFHLEMGLVRMVHAGRLLPIEEALAGLKNPGSQPQAPTPRLSADAPQPARPAPASGSQSPAPASEPRSVGSGQASPQSPNADARERLHAHLAQQGLTHLADAVENSRISLTASELQVATAKSYALYFRDRQLIEAVREAFDRPLKIQVTVSDDSAGPNPPSSISGPESSTGDDATQRALANPEVRRFQEVFPGSKVYKVRNLKE